MGVIVESTALVTKVALAGEIDLSNREEAERSLRRSCAELRTGDVAVLDLKDLAFLDAAGSGAITNLVAELTRRRVEFVLRRPRPLVREVLRAGGLLGLGGVRVN